MNVVRAINTLARSHIPTLGKFNNTCRVVPKTRYVSGISDTIEVTTKTLYFIHPSFFKCHIQTQPCKKHKILWSRQLHKMLCRHNAFLRKLLVRPAKTQISLCMCAGWSLLKDSLDHWLPTDHPTKTLIRLRGAQANPSLPWVHIAIL